jgi:hypothetical protein
VIAVAKPKKGVTPPQLKGFQFKSNSAKTKAAAMKGGKTSPSKKTGK